MNSLPKTVTRQLRGSGLNPGPSAPESSTLTTRLPSHPVSTGPVKRACLDIVLVVSAQISLINSERKCVENDNK